MTNRVLLIEDVSAAVNVVEVGANEHGLPIKAPGDEVTFTIKARWIEGEGLDMGAYELCELNIPSPYPEVAFEYDAVVKLEDAEDECECDDYYSYDSEFRRCHWCGLLPPGDV